MIMPVTSMMPMLLRCRRPAVVEHERQVTDHRLRLPSSGS
jgi:hypothetical protein